MSLKDVIRGCFLKTIMIPQLLQKYFTRLFTLYFFGILIFIIYNYHLQSKNFILLIFIQTFKETLILDHLSSLVLILVKFIKNNLKYILYSKRIKENIKALLKILNLKLYSDT